MKLFFFFKNRNFAFNYCLKKSNFNSKSNFYFSTNNQNNTVNQRCCKYPNYRADYNYNTTRTPYAIVLHIERSPLPAVCGAQLSSYVMSSIEDAQTQFACVDQNANLSRTLS